MVGPWDTQQYKLVLNGAQLSGTTPQSVFGNNTLWKGSLTVNYVLGTLKALSKDISHPAVLQTLH